MSTEMEKNQDIILQYLYSKDLESTIPREQAWAKGADIRKATNLGPVQINDAVELLHHSGLVERLTALGTAPYDFLMVKITARGKYEYERRKELESARTRTEVSGLLQVLKRVRPPTPIGSPYGITPQDWEVVSRKKANKRTLYVVLGCKFKSSYYDTRKLRKNVENMFARAVQRYNKENPGEFISLEFISLHAGYGEHVFNAIARDIISSDIAVFETSDLAPNVFIEIGVALTWGSRVFLVKEKTRPPPPSDISGHTWADYVDNARVFEDPEHEENLFRMVEHAIRKKG